MLDEIESSATRISDLVLAIKEYTYMDQAPVHNVDIVKGLESTLTILNHKLKHGVTVQREYERIPLLVNSFGSELNQVWTNLIDNAIDAMGGKGAENFALSLAAKRILCVVVEIGDNGPGIPSDALAHIFLSHSLPPRELAKEPASAWTPCNASVKKNITAIFKLPPSPANTLFQVWLPLADVPA